MISIAFIFVIGIVCFSYTQTKNISPTCCAFPRGNQQLDGNGKENSNSFQTTEKTFPEHMTNKLYRRLRTKRFGILYHHRSGHTACNQPLLFVPLPIQQLKFPKFEVLPNYDVRVNGIRLPNVCMPRNPILFEMKIENKVWSLFITSNLRTENPKKQPVPR